MIAIIDYNAGNIKSVMKAFDYIGQDVICTRDYKKIIDADGIVLPGVGSFEYAMNELKKYELDKAIHDVCDRSIPLLGICLGLQLLFRASDESPNIEGLSVLDGHIHKIPEKDGLKVPHMGWNSIELSNNGRLFDGISDNSYVYFVHSYYLKADELDIVTAETEYGINIHASVEKDNIFACQFHPEKSSDVGLKILRNFAEITNAH